VHVFRNNDAAALRSDIRRGTSGDEAPHDVDTSWEEILLAHQRLAAAAEPTKKFQAPYTTSATGSLIEELFRIGGVLNTGVAQGKTGTATRLVVGAPGLGKTTVLDAFAAIGPTVFEDLVVVRIDCTRLGDLFRSTELDEAVVEAVCAALDVPRPSAASGVSASRVLEDLLETREKKLLLLLDESQRLYGSAGDEEGALKRQRALGFLDGYANSLHRTGMFGALMTGSSMLSENLLSVSLEGMPPAFFKRFPGADSAPDLNRTKFKTQYILPDLEALLTDTQTVLSKMTVSDREFTDDQVRALALHTLGNPRVLENARLDGNEKHPDPSLAFESNAAYKDIVRTFQSKNKDEARVRNLDLNPLSEQEVANSIGLDEAGYKRAELMDTGKLAAFNSSSGLVFLPRDATASVSTDIWRDWVLPALRHLEFEVDKDGVRIKVRAG